MADTIKLQLSKLRTWLDKIPALKVAEEKTNVPKEYMVVGAGALVFLFLLFSTGAGFLWLVIADVGLTCFYHHLHHHHHPFCTLLIEHDFFHTYTAT